MEPTIKTGSVCFINKNADINKIKANDIIAFRSSDGALVTHRAIEIADSGIKTKGDNNKDMDGNRVTKANFVGKNLFWIPKAGFIVKAFQSTVGKIVLITCVVLLFAAGFLFGDDKKKKIEN